LADADPGREVEDGVDTLEGSANLVLVPHIADDEVDLVVQVIGRLATGPVNLRVEIVEGANVVTLREEEISQMRCNETGAAGDQDFFMHFRAFDITEDYNPVLVKRFNDARGNPVFRRRSQ
jgi:hypothetical protein